MGLSKSDAHLWKKFRRQNKVIFNAQIPTFEWGLRDIIIVAVLTPIYRRQ